MSAGDTIFALATAPGRAAVAVVRLSGPKVRAALGAVAGGVPRARRASLRRLRDGSDQTLDQALVLWFPAPASFTGEDCAELHLHGGRAVVEGVLEALAALDLRPAEAGEFARRAFENGKLELSEAEAVADLVDAETGAQRSQALEQLGGAITRRTDGWRESLLDALAHLEAAVDFPDEDLPGAVADRALAPLHALSADLAAALADSRGEKVREGYRIALIGAPNAGKSSLLNRLTGHDRAIVTAEAGTTRDVIEAPLNLGGYGVVVGDMAGLRTATNPVEAEGVRRARAWAQAASLRLWLVDRSGNGDWDAAVDLLQPGDLLVLAKGDLPTGPDAARAEAAARDRALEIVGMGPDGGSLSGLNRLLARRVAGDLEGTDFPVVTRQRHRAVLEEALRHLDRALSGGAVEPELVAEDVRLAARSLERMSGRLDPEDVLGRVFATFCIGK